MNRRWTQRLILTAIAISLITGCVNVAHAGLDQWTSTGPTQEGGIVKALAIDPQTPSTLHAGMQDIGAFKSTTGGASWSAANSGLPADGFVGALAIDPQTPTTLYVGSRGFYLGSASFDLGKSTDGGATFVSITNGIKPGSGTIATLAIDPVTPTTVYAATGTGAYKTLDGGANWSAMNTSLPAFTAQAIDPLTPTVLYAGVGGCNGVFKSTNGGGNWSEFNPGLTNRCINTLAINPQTPNILYAGTDGGGVFAIEQKSTSGAFVVSSVLPVSRSVQVGDVATAFASIINGGTTTGLNCGISPVTTLPATFAFQTTNCATNQLIGSLNTPVNIPAGGVGCFIFAFTPTSPIAPTDVVLSFDCTNTDPAPVYPGVNTFLLSASTSQPPDIIASGLPCPSDNFPISAVNLPGPTGANAVAFATTNVGAEGTITVRADTGSVSLPLTLTLTLCQTNPQTGACINPLFPAPTVTLTMGAGAQPTFSVFALGHGDVPMDLVKNRIFLRFWDSTNTVRGATSVAVRTHSPACAP